VLWRRHYKKEKALRKAKGGQKEAQAVWQGGTTSGGIFERFKGGLR
jgi:hypothetical protein